jgi:hypothetical protein
MKKTIIGLFLSLMLVAGVGAQDRYQKHQDNCYFVRDYRGRIYERCTINEYPYYRDYPYNRNYGQWRRYHNHNKRHRGYIWLGF